MSSPTKPAKIRNKRQRNPATISTISCNLSLPSPKASKKPAPLAAAKNSSNAKQHSNEKAPCWQNRDHAAVTHPQIQQHTTCRISSSVYSSHSTPPLSSAPASASKTSTSKTGPSSSLSSSTSMASSPSLSVVRPNQQGLTKNCIPSAKKKWNKWVCPRCHGNVRLPPKLPHDLASSDAIPRSRKVSQESNQQALQLQWLPFLKKNGINQSIVSTLKLLTVKCTLPGCNSPRYHLACSGIPMGSDLFRQTVLSSSLKHKSTHKKIQESNSVSANQNVSTDSTFGIYEEVGCESPSPTKTLERIYASSTGSWWKLPPLSDTKEMIMGPSDSNACEEIRESTFMTPNATTYEICQTTAASARDEKQQLCEATHGLKCDTGPLNAPNQINFPKNDNSPMLSTSFICPDCDVEGKSRYLLEYFERFHSMKKSFYAEYLGNISNTANYMEDVEECVEGRTGVVFLWHLMRRHKNEHQYFLNLNETPNQSDDNGDTHQVNNEVAAVSKKPTKSIHQTKKQLSSLAKTGRTTCSDDSAIEHWKSSEIRLSHMTRVFRFITRHQHQQERQKDKCEGNIKSSTSGASGQVNDVMGGIHDTNGHQENNDPWTSHLDPTCIVGMPVRLFNPVDNSYHSGRILDYKLNAPHKFDDGILEQSRPCRKKKRKRNRSSFPSFPQTPDFGQIVDHEICETLYLVRFRHGVDGRKVAVHQWLYLEEHAMMVGGDVCWARVRDEPQDGVLMWKRRRLSCDSTGGDVRNGKSSIKSNISATNKSNNNENGSFFDQPTESSIHEDQSFSREFLSLYRPVQIVFRSALEMIPVRDLNPSLFDVGTRSPQQRHAKTGEGGENTAMVTPNSLNVLAMSFGRAFRHARLCLDDSFTGNDHAKPATKQSERLRAKVTAASRKTTETNRSLPQSREQIKKNRSPYPILFPISSHIPSWLHSILRRVRFYDQDLALGLAAACMEKEEEKRVRTWKKLPVSFPMGDAIRKNIRETVTKSAATGRSAGEDEV